MDTVGAGTLNLVAKKHIIASNYHLGCYYTAFIYINLLFFLKNARALISIHPNISERGIEMYALRNKHGLINNARK